MRQRITIEDNLTNITIDFIRIQRAKGDKIER